MQAENQSPRRAPWGLLFSVTGLFIVLDQLSKAWIVANFGLYESRAPIPALRDVFSLTYTRNTGAAFGLFPSASLFFLVVAVIATIFIMYTYRQVQGKNWRAWLSRVAFGLMMAGALGNAIDRVTRGYVVDFLHVYYAPLNFDFPIFNVADMAVVIGVGSLILFMGWESKTDAQTSHPESDSIPESQPITETDPTP